MMYCWALHHNTTSLHIPCCFNYTAPLYNLYNMIRIYILSSDYMVHTCHTHVTFTHSHLRSYTDSCHARCWHAHQERYSASCPTAHSISVSSHSHTLTHRWNSHREQFGGSVFCPGTLGCAVDPTTFRLVVDPFCLLIQSLPNIVYCIMYNIILITQTTPWLHIVPYNILLISMLFFLCLQRTELKRDNKKKKFSFNLTNMSVWDGVAL